MSARVFDEWHDQPLDEMLTACRELVEDPEYPTVKRWRDAGGKAAAYFDTGIELDQAHGARVYHNTVVSKPTYSSIDSRWNNTQAEIRNNITYTITSRNDAKATADHNLQRKADIDEGDAWALDEVFVNPGAVNYRLEAGSSRAADQGVQVGEAGTDLDGQAHDQGPPDLGAYERTP